MNWMDKLLGQKKNTSSDTAEATVDSEAEAMLQATYCARDAFYSQLGVVDPDVMAPLVNPTFMGGPSWPAFRQAWRVIRRKDSVIIASDGLSDPFENEKIPLGFRVEVCAEQAGTINDIAGSWLFGLVYQVSQNVAGHGAIHELIEKYQTLSTILHLPEAPPEFRNEQGNVGVVIGFPATTIPQGFETPFGFVKLLVVTPLHPVELAFLESGPEMDVARSQLVEKLLLSDTRHLCVASRAPVVG